MLPLMRLLLRSIFVKVVLVSAKSRVSPLRKITIPPLELLGNLLLSRLISSVINNLIAVYSIDKIFAWTDSSIAYSWIKNINKVCKSFIQTRVQLIRELLSISCWRLVSSHVNPYDIVSRGFLLF